MRIIFTFFLSLFVITMNAQTSFDVDNTEGCYPLTVTFTNTSTGIEPGDYFVWRFNDGTPNLQTFECSHVFEHPGIYSVYLSRRNYLDIETSVAGPVTINILGTDSMFISTGLDACPGEKVWFESVLIDYEDNDSIEWIIEGDTMYYSTHLSHIFDDAGPHEIKLMAHSNTCGWDTVTKTIEITNTAMPIVDFNTSGSDEICINDRMLFYPKYPAESYLWDFDDGTTDTLQNPEHIFTIVGGKNITLTATNICGNSASISKVLNVRNDIEANAEFGFNDYNSSCPNTPIDFSAYYTGSYYWIFDTVTTSTEQNPTVLFSDTGYYQVQLILTNGCGNIDTSKVDTIHVGYDINNRPDANINFNMNNTWGQDTVNICPGQEVSFGNSTYPIQSVDYIWYFGDGDSSVVREPTHIFNTTSEIMLIAQNQCLGKDTAKLWVNVDMSTQPTSVLGVLPDTICQGEQVYFIDYQSESNHFIDNNHNYYIDFGDGQSLSNPSIFTDSLLPIFFHEYENLGSYNYTFSVENQCGNSIEQTGVINVLDNAHVPNQYLVYNPTDPVFGGSDGCPNDSIIFMAFGGGSYEWHFGDGLASDTGRVVYHAYADTGMYNAYVVITTNCGEVDTLESIVNISGNNIPELYFDILGDGSCSGDTVQFVADDHGVSSEFYTYQWFVDGDSVASGVNIDYIFDHGGDFDVKLETSNGCGSGEVHRHVFINSPILSFNVNDNVVIPGENVVFTNSSTNATSYLWDFGDGNTSTSISPTHSYSSYGYYDITLTGTNSDGCSYTDTWNNYILVSDIQVNTLINDASCYGLSDGYLNISVTGGLPPYTMSCQEDLGNQYLAEGMQYGVSFAKMPAGTYHIDITDANNTHLIKTYIINQPDAFVINAEYTDETCFRAKDGKIKLNVTGGVEPYTYSWEYEDSSSGNFYSMPDNLDSICNLTSEVPTNYNVTVTDDNGCSANFYSLNNYYLHLQNEAKEFYVVSANLPDCGNNNGNISISEQGYWNPLTVEWEDGSTGVAISGLSAGIYTATVTDNVTGCSAVENVELNNQNSNFNISDNNIDLELCPGETNGYISVEVYNGSGDFTYQWSSNILPANMISDSVVYHLSPGHYELTVTDNSTSCEMFKNYDVVNRDAPVLFFEKQNPSCYGAYTGNAIVNPSSEDAYSYQYAWSNGSTVNQIVNRPAGTYTVTVTDDYYGCSTIGSVTLENPPEMSLSIYSSNATTYGANDGVVSVIVNNGEPIYNYNWSSNISSTIAYSTATDLEPGQYYVTVTDENTCTATGSATIDEPAMINISITANETQFCYGQTTNIEAPYNSSYTYEWSTGETTDIISVGESGTYVVTVSNGISIGIDSVEINVVHPYSDEKICMVTVDTSSMYNVIMWNKTENVGITEYKIYKLFGTQYLEIGSQPFDDYSVFVDSASQPNVHADRYKISIVDTCGNESDLSPYHQTMYMGISDNTIGSNTIVILDWDEASVNEGAQAIEWYYIYRGTDILALTKIDSVSGVFTGWNDNNSLNGYYYRVAYNVDDVCYPSSLNKTSGGPYNQSISNIDDYSSGPTDIDEYSNLDNVQIYPNPFFDKTRIYMPDEVVDGNYTIRLTDLSGKRIILDEKIKTRVYTLYRNNLPNGIYFIEIRGDKLYRRKLIVN